MEYPKEENTKLMMLDELEAYHKKLAQYHCERYAGEREGDGLSVESTMLAEYAVDCMHEDDGCSESVYDWINDPDHWIWDVALAAQESNDDSF